MSEGIVYILTNPGMPNLIKIGVTSREDIKKRMQELYSTGVPYPFELEYAMKISNAEEIENIIHSIFGIHRVNINREFFEMEAERAVLALKLTKGQEVRLDEKDVYDQEDIQTLKNAKKTPIDPFRFEMVDIKAGDELVFSRDPNVKCTVAEPDDNFKGSRVIYKDEIYSLSSLATKLLGVRFGVRGPQYWLFNNKLLTELREEKAKASSQNFEE